MPDAYLDSSALVKRYVQEPGTAAVDVIVSSKQNYLRIRRQYGLF